jgi:hypothetical protein
MKELDTRALDGRDLVGEVREVARKKTRRHRRARIARVLLSAN